jgi:DNA gyrase subunit A
VIAIQCSDRNGALVAAVATDPRQELMLISDKGTLVRTRVAEVSQVGRNTQGVTLIRLPEDEKLVGVVRIENGDEDVGAETNGDGVGDAPIV